MVAVRIYEGDEDVVEFADESVLSLGRLLYEVPDIDTVYVLTPDEAAIEAWREADGLTQDRLAAVREHRIAAAQARGDLAALAIMGVGGRRFA